MPDAIRPYHGIVLRSSFPVMSLLFVLGAILLIIFYVQTRDVEFVALLVGCVLASFICFPKLKLGKTFQITEEGIDLDQGKLKIAWNQIESCDYGGYKISPEIALNLQSRPVAIHFGRDSLRLNVVHPESNNHLYRGIWNILLANTSPQLSEPLASTLRAASEKYGTERIIAAGSKANYGRMKVRGRVVTGVFAFLLAAIIGACIGQGERVAIALAAFSGLILTLISTVFVADRLRLGSLSHNGAIVLTPQHLSLQTKKLKGSLKWSDLKEVALTPSSNKPIRLRLRVAGADIILDDSFQLPLWLLFERVQWYQANYRLEPQQAKLVNQNQSGIEVPEVEEDYNPFRPPRT
ncbi:MAG: hypothetical protein U0930_26370 [Pirellulales bacterium]